MDKKKIQSYKTAGILFLIASVLFICSFILNISSTNNYMKLMYLILSASNLAVGSYMLYLFNKNKDSLDEKNINKKA